MCGEEVLNVVNAVTGNIYNVWINTNYSLLHPDLIISAFFTVSFAAQNAYNVCKLKPLSEFGYYLNASLT